MKSFLIITLLPLLGAAAEGDGHSGHNHGATGEVAYEWAGIFAVSGSFQTLGLQRVESESDDDGDHDGHNHGRLLALAYADATMKIVLLPTNTADEATLSSLKEDAQHSFEENCTVTKDGATIVPKDDACFELHLEGAKDSAFTINTTGMKGLAFFAEHFPTEFERDLHYLKDSAGEDVEPLAEIPEEAKVDLPNNKGLAYLASVIVVVVSFSGVVLANKVIITLFGGQDRFARTSEAFACGALLFAAFALLLPESLHLIGAEGDDGTRYDEGEVSAIYASSVTIGVVMCIMLDVGSNYLGGKGDNLSAPKAQVHGGTNHLSVEMAEVANLERGANGNENGAASEKKKVASDLVPAAPTARETGLPLVYQIIIGDFFHNLIDGIIIGAAFMSCDSSAGWTVTAGTIYHEISQEIADFLVLINDGGLSFKQAALGNFISALGVIFGCILVTESEPSAPVQGGLMAFGASFYLFIALSQLRWWIDRTDLLRNSCFFVLGCLGIGLVLIDHQHCVPVTGDDPHAGHGH